MEVDKIEAFDYMLHLFEEWRDNHETIKGKPSIDSIRDSSKIFDLK